jgi:UDP-N-acetylglucosamine--N-acetylmuramyl-(pentapeptide) pyrophosphoryl-undecaprenol N-acetylglucosamine transferase
MPYSFVLTGGGTGGHVFPALAVGQVLRNRGHRLLFIGTREGMEAKLVPPARFEMEFIRSGGLNRVGLRKQTQSAMQLPVSVGAAAKLLRRYRPQAIFSTGGYVAGPVMLAAVLTRIPIVLMEPNIVPGLANRKIGRWVYRALVGFEATCAWFPPGKSEVTGLPVRSEFFEVQPKRDGVFTVLITGASRGARTLNEASRGSWPLFRAQNSPVRIIHQAGAAANYETLVREFAGAGIAGEITQFIPGMAKTFSQTDLVVCRAGAGTVNELSAAGMAAILVPFPFAADEHQRKNAEALVAARAGRMVPDQEMNGERLFREVESLRNAPQELAAMRANVRQFASPGAAQRAADVMEEAARTKTVLIA